MWCYVIMCICAYLGFFLVLLEIDTLKNVHWTWMLQLSLHLKWFGCSTEAWWFDQQVVGFAWTHFGLVLPPLMVASPLASTFLITPPTTTSRPIFFAQKIFWDLKFYLIQKIFDPNFFGFEIFVGSKKILDKNFFDAKLFGAKFYFDYNIFLLTIFLA